MKQLTLNDLQKVSGCGGGGVKSPPPPPRETKTINTDGNYNPPPAKTEEGN